MWISQLSNVTSTTFISEQLTSAHTFSSPPLSVEEEAFPPHQQKNHGNSRQTPSGFPLSPHRGIPSTRVSCRT